MNGLVEKERCAIEGITYKNLTKWRDDELIYIIDRIASEELTSRYHRKRKLKVFVKPSRSRSSKVRHTYRQKNSFLGCHGWAHWRKHMVELMIPSGNIITVLKEDGYKEKKGVIDRLNFDDMLEFCHLVAHEFWHIEHQRGGQHVEIFLRRHWKYGRPKTEEDQKKQRDHFAWVEDYCLRT